MVAILFVVEQVQEGGYVARAVGESIVTEADSVAELHSRVRDAVHCHFDEGQALKTIGMCFVRDDRNDACPDPA
jgi:uncharacterized protein (UPF0261 family)